MSAAQKLVSFVSTFKDSEKIFPNTIIVIKGDDS